MGEYVQRRLTLNKGSESERVISEAEIDTSAPAIIILGDPGLGKSELTKQLEARISGVRVAAGTFYRNEDISRYAINPSPLIIDGLDEITASSGASAIDEVLKRLSRIGHPRFVLSCRSADWQGSVDRYKITSDYGFPPITLHLEPFSRNDAITFLSNVGFAIDAEKALDTLAERGLDEFYGNPLTLELLGELLKSGGALPARHSDLLAGACRILVREANFAHKRSVAVQQGPEILQNSAGAIFAHLLLSNSLGIADRELGDIPSGYVSISDIVQLADNDIIRGTLTTRLFKSEAEGLFIPFHRVIAEYLGARWIAERVSAGLSKRRVFAAMTNLGGVPTALRGIHAWLAHFNASLAGQCITSDPYGILKYGAIDTLPTNLARLLLRSLAALAAEDPYFRSEDSGRSGVAGLTRPELMRDILDLIRTPDRHHQLSTLLLGELRNSSLTQDIADELVAIILDESSSYDERFATIQALSSCNCVVSWREIVNVLGRSKRFDDRILVLDVIGALGGQGFTGAEIGLAISRYYGFQTPESNEEDEDELSYVTSVDISLVESLTPKTCAAVLDSWVGRKRKNSTGKKERQRRRQKVRQSQIVEKLIAKCLEDGEHSAGQIWAWMKLNREQSLSRSSSDETLERLLSADSDLRRSIQRCAFHDEDIEGGPWIAIAHTLPRIHPALALKIEDVQLYLAEISAKESLAKSDVELWISLVRSMGRRILEANGCRTAAEIGASRHRILRKNWIALTNFDKKNDWELQAERRVKRERKRREEQFRTQRANLVSHKDEIVAGRNLGVLEHLATGYLNLYSELDSDLSPVERLTEWLGDDLAGAALEGFQRVLLRDDLPTLELLGECHARGERYNTEFPVQCGIIEADRNKRDLSSLSTEVLKSVLASWWDVSPDKDVAGEGIEERVEALVFSSEENKQHFLRSIIEPQLGNGSRSVKGLYRLKHDELFADVAGGLATTWLKRFPNASPAAQADLLETAVSHGNIAEAANIVHARLGSLQSNDEEARSVWLPALFLLDFERNQQALADFCSENRDRIWSIRSFVRPERKQYRKLSIAQLEFIVAHFSEVWPSAGHPRGGWGGDTNPWDATDFILSCMDAIGSSSEDGAESALVRLIERISDDVYKRRLKHVRTLYRRARRDREFNIPTFDQVRRTLCNGLPAGPADLKAVLMDAIQTAQDYLKNGDTMGWDAFWREERPKIENRCRDRFLDLLRSQMPDDILLLPETAMPDLGRADIGVLYQNVGIPIELKGQWNETVWRAADDQLIEKYSKDWRAQGHGIYLVLWFGDVSDHNLPLHPEGKPRPTNTTELCELLEARLSATQRQKIEVVVVDVSRPVSSGSPKKAGKRKERARSPKNASKPKLRAGVPKRANKRKPKATVPKKNRKAKLK